LLFLTELMGLPVFDLKQRRIGRVKDAAIVPRTDRDRVDRYLVGGGWAWLAVRHDQVRSIGLDGLFLSDEQLTPYHNDEYMLRLVRDLLDQQIIDAHGRKVVRVTDLTFSVRPAEDGHDEMYVVDVDIGLRSVFRRLAQGVVPPRLVRRIQRPIAPNSIDWKDCNFVEADPRRRLYLNISHDYLEQMHPADIADIVEDLGPDEREAIIASIDSEVAAEALSEVEPEMQANILEALEPEKAADIIEEMDPAEAADVLDEMEEETAEEILEEMEPESKTEVSELLELRDDSAGRLMTSDYVSVPHDATVAQALAALRARDEVPDELTAVFLDGTDGRLAGMVPLVRLLLAAPDTRVSDLTFDDLLTIEESERTNRVAETFDKYNLLTLPVVDDRGRMVGAITADDVISLLRES
jgi:flagellar motility protein MotE (MotC chaperone)/sporulation protein YlmC with PRC-barrel domain